MYLRRSPSGERGLKSAPHAKSLTVSSGRSPSGERGLKFCVLSSHHIGGNVAPHPGSVD